MCSRSSTRIYVTRHHSMTEATFNNADRRNTWSRNTISATTSVSACCVLVSPLRNPGREVFAITKKLHSPKGHTIYYGSVRTTSGRAQHWQSTEAVSDSHLWVAAIPCRSHFGSRSRSGYSKQVTFWILKTSLYLMQSD
jgi:hypothetical protein